MTLRVAQIIGPLTIGGAERHFVNLVNRLPCDYRTAIFLVESRTDPSLYDELEPSVEQRFIRVRKRRLPVDIFRLASLLRTSQCNVVHTHMFWPSLYGCIAATMARVPVVVTTEHGENPWKNRYHRWLERNVISRITAERFCVSDSILRQRRDIDGVPADKLSRMVNGTPLPDLPAQRDENEVLVIGTVGRFVPPKDYPRLLEAAAELKRLGYQFQLAIVGDGPDMGDIKNRVTALDLDDHVQLPGLVTDVDAWYRRFDIYVCSSSREGQPVSLLEAMAYRLPIVTTNAGAIAEMVQHGESGVVVPREDTAALVEGLAGMLNDQNARSTYGKNARARVEVEFSIQVVAEHYYSCYVEHLAHGQHVRNV